MVGFGAQPAHGCSNGGDRDGAGRASIQRHGCLPQSPCCKRCRRLGTKPLLNPGDRLSGIKCQPFKSGQAGGAASQPKRGLAAGRSSLKNVPV